MAGPNGSASGSAESDEPLGSYQLVALSGWPAGSSTWTMVVESMVGLVMSIVGTPMLGSSGLENTSLRALPSVGGPMPTGAAASGSVQVPTVSPGDNWQTGALPCT